MLAASPLASSAPSFTDGQFGHLASDPALVRKFAEVVREEYSAAGFRCAPHRTLDLAMEPRWARLSDNWGEDASLTAEMIVSYIEGFHGDGFGPHSVAAVTKYFPGGCPVENGEVFHFSYGRTTNYPGNNFGYHLVPFKAIIAARARAMMPHYSRIVLRSYRPQRLGGLITNQNFGQSMPAKACCAEHLSEPERVLKILNAGADPIGSEHVTDMLVDLIWNGPVSEERIDTSVRRLLREKYPSPSLTTRSSIRAQPSVARATSILSSWVPRLSAAPGTPLTNNDTVPLRRARVAVVDTPDEADLALLKVEAPSFPRSGAFQKRFTSGFSNSTKRRKARQAKIYAAVFATYGVSPDAFLDVVFGLAKPEGRLPFDLPRFIAAVEAQFEDVPLRYRGPRLLVRRRKWHA
ncbi:hypothetical protein DL764_006004 [Monosporascus ibericus]|uniref:beta-glucosidase n=1 Tax=Monosporascus ibericus TaxID=155417 RepID=A0A4V1XA98_9PEZI|nr:hypothetical protein DL764_006004 [Monosporascus ibericus]